MLKSIKNWWNKDKIEIARLRKEVSDSHECLGNSQDANFQKIAEIEALRELLQQKIGELESLRKEHPDMKAEGVLDPWMIIEANGENTLKGLKIKIDWNEAMVQHMKDKGHNIRDENVLMQHFLVQLYEHVIQLLEWKSVDESDIHRTNEFE